MRRIFTCSSHANTQTSPVTHIRRQVTRQHTDVASNTLAMPLYMLSTCSSTPSTPVSPVGQFYGVAISILLLHYVGPRHRKRLTRIPSGNKNFASYWWQAIKATMKFARNSIDGFENNGPQNSPEIRTLLDTLKHVEVNAANVTQKIYISLSHIF